MLVIRYNGPEYTKTIKVQSFYRKMEGCQAQSNVRYFFVTDKIQKGEVKVAYCLMENMPWE